MITKEQIAAYHENGFVHISQVFTKEEIDELSDEPDRLVQDWAFTSPGRRGFLASGLHGSGDGGKFQAHINE